MKWFEIKYITIAGSYFHDVCALSESIALHEFYECICDEHPIVKSIEIR